MQRSPLKRTGFKVKPGAKTLKRTGFKPKQPAANAPPRKPLPKKVSEKTQLFNAEFEKMKPVIKKRSGGFCEARIPSVCTGRGDHVHHRKLRGQGGTNAEENLIHLCFACHHHAHHAGNEAYEKGWLLRAWDEETPFVSKARK